MRRIISTIYENDLGIRNFSPLTKWILSAALFLSLVLGFIVSVSTAPFSNPDEGAHFLRAVEVSNGEFVRTTRQPSSSISCEDYFEVGAKYAPIAWYEKVEERSDFKEDNCMIGTLNTASYLSGVPYMFSAPADFASRNLGFSVTERLAAQRFSNFLASTLVLVLVVLLLGQLSSPFVLLFLSPAGIWYRASNSADVLTNSFSLLFLAFIFVLYLNRTKISLQKILLLTLVACLIGLTKSAFVPIALVALVLWRNSDDVEATKLNCYLRRILLLLPFTCSLATAYLVSKITSSDLLYLGNGADPGAQLEYVLGHPLQSGAVFAKALAFNWDSFIGMIWIPVWGGHNLSLAFSILFSTCLVILTLGLPFTIGRLVKILFAVISLGLVIAPVLAMYLYYTPIGYSSVLGVQGRYFVPAVILGIFSLVGSARKYITFHPAGPLIFAVSLTLPISTVLLLGHIY